MTFCTNYHCAGDCGLPGHGRQHEWHDDPEQQEWVISGQAMSTKTQLSREWRAEQRRLGHVPKLIWPHKDDWPRIQGLLAHLKKRRKAKEQP